MKVKKSFGILLMIILCLSVVLAGCSSSSSGQAETPSDNSSDNTANDQSKSNDSSTDSGKTTDNSDKKSDKPVTITYGSWAGKKVKKVIKLFEESHPNINVVHEKSVTWPWNEKLAAAAAAGKLPDVFWTFGIDKAVANGWARDLTPLLKKDENFDKNSLYKSLVNTANYDGHQFAMPATLNAYVIYLNTDLFKQANVPIPDADWTFEEMRQDAIKLTDYNKHQFGFANPQAMRLQFIPEFDPSQGWGTWDGEKYNFDKEAFAKSYELTAAMIHEDKVSLKGIKKEQKEKWYGKGKNPWTLGKVAMKLGATWGFTGNTKNNKFNWKVLPLPKVEGQRLPMVADYVAMSKSTEHVKAAYTFLKWLTFSKEGWAARSEAGLTGTSFPLVNSEEVWKNYLSSKNVPESAKPIIKMIPNGTVDPFKWLPGYIDVQKLIFENYKKFQTGKAKPAEVGDELQQKAMAIYKEARQKMEAAMNSN